MEHVVRCVDAKEQNQPQHLWEPEGPQVFGPWSEDEEL